MIFRRMALSALALSLAAACALAADNPPAVAVPTAGLRAITRPSGDVTLAFVRPGMIVKMYVKEGDHVSAKQIVAEQDDSEEKKQLELDQAIASDQTELDIDKRVLEKDKVDRDKMLNNAASTEFEKRQAVLQVEIDEARIKGQQEKMSQAVIKVRATEVLLKKLQLASPIDGVVAQTMVHEGETVDAGNMKVMRIVQVDPLWVEVPVPIAVARLLKQGDSAQVTFTDKQVRPGKVALVFPVGDAASATINVRVEVPNPQKLQSGENVNVVFPSQVADKGK